MTSVTVTTLGGRCRRATATNRHRKRTRKRVPRRKYRSQHGAKCCVTWARWQSRKRNGPPSAVGRHGRSHSLSGGPDQCPGHRSVAMRTGREGLPDAERNLLTSAVRGPDPRGWAGVTRMVAGAEHLSHDGLLLRESSLRRVLFAGYSGAFCCRHSADLKFISRLVSASADGPPPGNSRRLIWAHGETRGPRLRPGRSNDSSRRSPYACRATRCRQGKGAEGRTVSRSGHSFRFASVRRRVAHLLIGNADRSSSEANIERPSSRRLYRQTYSFTYPCSHFGETA
jgi:hypothetical protein